MAPAAEVASAGRCGTCTMHGRYTLLADCPPFLALCMHLKALQVPMG